METSFRAILSEFLEEAEAESPTTAPHSATVSSSVFSELLLAFPAGMSAARRPKRHGYASNRRQGAAPKTEPLPEPRETTLALDALSGPARDHVMVLMQMGASELDSGLSVKRLKSAHRRLAKRLHPDTLPADCAAEARQAAAKQFRALHAAYKALLDLLNRSQRSLTQDTSSACGNGSVWE